MKEEELVIRGLEDLPPPAPFPREKEEEEEGTQVSWALEIIKGG